MSTERKDGFYWVKVYSGWVVCEWRQGRGLWLKPGDGRPLTERDIDTIYEIPIMPPTE